MDNAQKHEQGVSVDFSSKKVLTRERELSELQVGALVCIKKQGSQFGNTGITQSSCFVYAHNRILFITNLLRYLLPRSQGNRPRLEFDG